MPSETETHDPPMENHFYRASAADFKKIPGSPIAYSLGAATVDAYDRYPTVNTFGETGSGLQTSDNKRFLRFWHEVPFPSMKLDARSGEDARRSNCRWFPHKKGGPYRKWYGNNDYVLNWKDGGAELYEFAGQLYGSPTRIIKNTHRYFQRGITWSHTTSSRFSARLLEEGFIFNVEAPSLFNVDEVLFLTYLCSSVGTRFIELANPTLHFISNSVGELPFAFDAIEAGRPELSRLLKHCLTISRVDWDSYETSWGFTDLPLSRPHYRHCSLARSYDALRDHWREMTQEMQHLEEENNRVFIDAYGLQDELTPDVPLSEITLTCNPHYRYGGEKTEEQREALLKADTMMELISYAVGCMMGRYSLDEPGLIYAHSGNVNFEAVYYGGEGLGGRGEGRKTEKTAKGESCEDRELQGFDCLAEGDGVGREGVSHDGDVSQGGAVRAEQSDAARGGVHPVEHRGRPREEFKEGVSELFVDGAGLDGRTGDTSPDRGEAGICNGETNRANSDAVGRDFANARGAEEEARATGLGAREEGRGTLDEGGDKNSTLTVPQGAGAGEGRREEKHSPLDPNLSTLNTPLCPRPVFAPDYDGIIPITDEAWFEDDAANRFEAFVKVAWPAEHLEENLTFIAESLGPKKDESSRETIRRYLSQGFYKHHLSMYKKRPIYWLFSSGKQRAFECLVYLHRYNEGTLGRMRTEYVIPLQGKIDARIDQLADDIAAATSTSHRNKLQKERDKLLKQQAELRAFDEKLRHYADQRISLDLDDGVKVNYGKFGDLLAEVKGVTGEKEE